MKESGGLLYLTAKEMAEIDRAAIQDYGMDVTALMENAGGAVANLAIGLVAPTRRRRVTFLSGKGNNGGDGLVAARRLHNWGAGVSVVLGCEEEELHEVPARQLAILKRMGVRISGPDAELEGDLLVDALLGYGSKGDPRGPVAALIVRANRAGLPILAVDLPSGLDATSGMPGDPCITANSTVTFGFPKTGFIAPGARSFVGELYLADISLPRGLVGTRRSKSNPFRDGAPVRLDY